MAHIAAVSLLQDGLTPLERAEQRNQRGVAKLLRTSMRTPSRPQSPQNRLSASLRGSTDISRDQLRPKPATKAKALGDGLGAADSVSRR